ncbi:hypothetical protein TWF281_004374 [Arthrobotrys megalospora]
MPTHKGVTCNLYIDGSRATEHHIVTEDDTCTAWVVPEEGKSYHLDINAFGTGTPQHRVEFWADGQCLESYDLRHSTIRRVDKAIVERTANGNIITSPLTFGKLKVAEDDVELMETRAEVIGEIGSMKLSIWRCKFVRYPRANPGKYTASRVEPMRVVKEQLLKGQPVSHCTQFGTRTTNPAGGPSRWAYNRTYIDPKDKPLATFVFNYASKALLQAQGYMPRTPSPELMEDGLEDMTHEDLMKEVMRLREENTNTKRQIKQEKNSQAIRRIGKRTTHIDLTVDDD